MVTRREVMTNGALGALAAAVDGRTGVEMAATEAAGERRVPVARAVSAQALREIADDIAAVRRLMRDAFIGPTVAHGALVEIRRQFGIFLKSNQKYPDYCEIGPAIFMDLYDWHVRYQQPHRDLPRGQPYRHPVHVHLDDPEARAGRHLRRHPVRPRLARARRPLPIANCQLPIHRGIGSLCNRGIWEWIIVALGIAAI